MAIQSGSIDGGSYLHNSHSSYRGNTISGRTFFNLLGSGQDTYAPNWPAEILEYPNLYEYVANDPIDGIDPFGLTWWKPWTWEWPEALWEGIKTGYGEMGTAIDTPKCVLGAYQAAPAAQAEYNYLTNDDIINAPIPPTPR